MRTLWYFSLAAQAVLLIRLNVLHILPIFRAYLLLALLRSVLLIVAARVYEPVWAATEPLLLILQFFVAVECLRRIRDSFPGIGRVAQWVLWAASVAALIGCAVSILPDVRGAATWTHSLTAYSALAKRALGTILALLLASVLWAIRSIQSAAPRNTLTHARIMAIFFAINSGAMALVFSGVVSGQAGNAVILSAAGGCFALWAAILSGAGETVPAPVRSMTETELDTSADGYAAHVRSAESLLRSIRPI